MFEPSTDSIFVAIAAYREPELRRTIDSCVQNAADPDRLRFGICLQYDTDGPAETQPDCLDGHPAALEIRSYDWTESRGGCWARHDAQGLYQGETFTLQIDSHMRMAQNWDAELVAMMRDLPSDKPLITGQCPLYNLTDGVDVYFDDGDHVPVTLAKRFADVGWIDHPAEVRSDQTGVPRPTRIMSGMFAFTVGQWNVEVRQDPEHLYTGEELALTIRSFTWGYDLFNPSSVVAWHRNHPEGNAKYIYDGADNEVRRRHERALQRLRMLHAGDPDRVLEPYSTGPMRSIDEFGAWSGLEYRTRSISDDARNGVAPSLFSPDW